MRSQTIWFKSAFEYLFNSLFGSLLIYSLPVMAGSPLPVPALAVEANKSSGVSELMIEQCQLNNKVTEAIEQAGSGVTRLAESKNPKITSEIKKNYAQASATYGLEKMKIKNEMNEALRKDLEKTFTAAELKYLGEACKNPLLKKYNDFLNSDSYVTLMSKPYSRTAILMRKPSK